MPSFRLLTLGRLTLQGVSDGRPVATGRRLLALLALLAASGERGVARDRIVALLWPERDEEHGRNSLSQALSLLRRALAARHPVCGATALTLNPDIIASDIADLEQRIAAGELEQATTRYEGPFLDGFFVRGAPEFERWVESQRARVHHLQTGTLLRLARTADEHAHHDIAVSWWRRLASLDPMSGRAALGLMRALAAGGHCTEALRHYREHASILQAELGVAPDECVEDLARRLRSRGARRAPELATTRP